VTLRRLFLLAAAALALSAPADAFAHGNASAQVARSAIKGEHRVLVVLLTWGPETFSREQVDGVVFGQTNEWLQRSSYGQTSIAGDVTPWLKALPERPLCQLESLSARARAAARAAGYDPSAYRRWIYVLPSRVSCPFTGVAFGEEVLLNGAVTRRLVAHELGHTYGLGFHANTWECDGACRSREYGDPFDTMGSGAGDFNAYEKYVLGWITNVARPQAPGTFRIAELEHPSTLPYALVVTTARHEYWLDHRSLVPDGALLDFALTDGVLVHAGPNPRAPLAKSVFPHADLLLPDPVGRGRPAILPGESWGEAGAFTVTVADKVAGGVELAFTWADAKPPRAPTIVDPPRAVRARGRRTLEIGWSEPAETGSGIARYEVRVAGGALRSYPGDSLGGYDRVRMPRPGTHTLSVVAVDRAGNRSPASVRRFTVRR
jgi:hypothetical protein